MRLLPTSLDDLIPEDHRARELWRWLDSFDLEPFYALILARGSSPGRPSTDPKILLCLWLFATSEGIGSARRIALLCERDLAYRWICGGVSLNHHALSDFRTGFEEELDSLMTEILGVLMHAKVLTLQRVSQDGVRVRASAGAASFRRKRTLQRCLEDAEKHVAQVKEQGEDESSSEKQKKARERAAQERAERIRKALEELPRAREAKTKKKDKAKTRTSTTDPEARVMKMADGGFRPAYNVQLAVDTESRFIVGVDVTNKGSDYGELRPMYEQIQKRTGRRPREYLVDGGFADHKDITHLTSEGVTVYAPVPIPRRKKGETEEERAERAVQRFLPSPRDPEAVAAWRIRMGTEAAKETYKERAATVETVNGDLRRHRGLTHIPVRGQAKARCVALLGALTYNLLRAMKVLSASLG